MKSTRVQLRHRQKGAVIVTVALTLLFLLGFMAIALDFGRLFVVKTELQTAMDSCALAAAQELDGAIVPGDAMNRATSAGKTAGNLNKVHFQGGAAGIVDADITFSVSLIGTYTRDPVLSPLYKYAKCTRTKAGMAPWLLQAMSGFTGNAAFSANQGVQALGVATRAPSQTTCAIPIGLCKKPGGYQPGEWLLGAVNASEAVTGQFRWVDFTANTGGGAKELKDVLKGEGQCDLPGTDTVAGKPGNNGSAADAYNSRFGIYLGNKGPPDDGIPDLTGYGWYSEVAIPQPPYPNKYPVLFATKRATFAPYQGDNQVPDTLFLQTVGNVYSGSLATAGSNRRIVVAPMLDCAAFDGLGGTGTIKIDSLACILLLHPVKKGAGPNSTKMWVEYLGAANAPGSPCSSLGLAGGAGGPLVPVLVQ
jgi:putative Flp pilus-assembly TadE/G-like protein